MCGCCRRQRFGRLQRNWRISVDQRSSYRTRNISSQCGSSPLTEEPSFRHEFDPETITALDTIVPPHPPGVLCAQTERHPRPGAPKRPFLRPGCPAALTSRCFLRGTGHHTTFLTSLLACLGSCPTPFNWARGTAE